MKNYKSKTTPEKKKKQTQLKHRSLPYLTKGSLAWTESKLDTKHCRMGRKPLITYETALVEFGLPAALLQIIGFYPHAALPS